MRRVAAWLALACLGSVGVVAAAEEKARSRLDQALDRVVAAFEAKDEAVLDKAAAYPSLARWTFVDALCGREAFDAATEIARRAEGPEAEALRAFVAANRARPTPASRRQALQRMIAASKNRDWEAAVSAAPAAAAEPADVVSVKAAFELGSTYRRKGDLAAAVESYAAAARAARSLGWLAVASQAHHQVGRAMFHQRDWAKAATAYQAAVEVDRTRGDLDRLSLAWYWLGRAHSMTRKNREALDAYDRALALSEQTGDRERQAAVQNSIGALRMRQGDFGRAARAFEETLRVLEAIGSPDRASAAANAGGAYIRLARHAEALALLERALALHEEAGNETGISTTLNNIGILHRERKDLTRASETFERALRIAQKREDDKLIAHALTNLAAVAMAAKDYERALEITLEAQELKTRLGDRAGVGGAHVQRAEIALRAGDAAKAHEHVGKAIAIAEETGDKALLVLALRAQGHALDLEEKPKEALAAYEKSARLAERLRYPRALVAALQSVAEARLALGDVSGSLATAKRAVPMLEDLLRRLAEEQGAEARGGFQPLFEVGLRAAVKEGDVAEVLYFLESGRAGALLESLDGGRRFRAAVVPEDLREADREARAAERAALDVYREALASGKRAEAREKGRLVDAARDKVRTVGAEIQRRAKEAAEVLYPRAATLYEVQEWIRKDEALVLYGAAADALVALVVTPGDARMVLLDPDAVNEAVGDLGLDDPDVAPEAAIGALTKALIAPLALPKTVRRVLISPVGSLIYLPFALLLPGREVAYLPSASTLGVLLEQARRRGEGVLALGDPVYDEESVQRVDGRRARLAPLPGSRAEVQAITDAPLLGKAATEQKLREALGTKRRWRSVHLACHGLLDGERWDLSALALTQAPPDDGLLTALEVFGMKVPAELVVLSACETGRGRTATAEGLMGLSRSFFVAGCPRVLCSLWKVDDEATRALMTRFYELWNPEEGQGIPPAQALQKAQAHVRSQARWAHPYYWAAWVLWGLPL